MRAGEYPMLLWTGSCNLARCELTQVLAALKPESIGKVVLLDCFGPLMVFQENSSVYLHEAANLFLNHARAAGPEHEEKLHTT